MADSILNNLKVKSVSISNKPNNMVSRISDKRLVEDINGDQIYVKISNFEEDGTIRITGDYSQNYVDFPKYDLSPLVVLDDIKFKFILAIKETPTSAETTYYTSKEFYENGLLTSYQNNEPYLVDATIKQEKIVVVELSQYKTKIEELRESEISIPIQEIFEGGVLVTKNLFMNSNYEEDSNARYGIKANPTYDVLELVRYVDWVVSKPSSDYDNRLLNPRTIGSWNEVDTQTEVDTTPSPSEPSTETTNTTTTNYEPIGRAGTYTGEIAQTEDGDEYRWFGSGWLLYDRGDDRDEFNR